MKKPILKQAIPALNMWKYYPKSDWSEGAYNDIFRKAADAKRKREAKAREEEKQKREEWLEDKAGIEA